MQVVSPPNPGYLGTVAFTSPDYDITVTPYGPYGNYTNSNAPAWLISQVQVYELGNSLALIASGSNIQSSRNSTDPGYAFCNAVPGCTLGGGDLP
jgi:hypothetical protein